jgi:toxin ParE1/3/4
MAHRVVWSPRALADVDAIASYIAADSPFYAGSVVRRILTLTRTLEQFSFAGRKVPEFDDGEAWRTRPLFLPFRDHETKM